MIATATTITTAMAAVPVLVSDEPPDVAGVEGDVDAGDAAAARAPIRGAGVRGATANHVRPTTTAMTAVAKRRRVPRTDGIPAPKALPSRLRMIPLRRSIVNESAKSGTIQLTPG